MRDAVVVAAFVLCALLCAVSAPLLAYTASLACFGLAHVVVELRYVDARFGRRLPPGLWSASALLIGGVVLMRGLRLGGFVWPHAVTLELLLVTALVVVGAVLARRSRVVGVVGAVAIAAIGLGTVVVPLQPLLTLAALHNLTPPRFVVERAAPSERRRAVVVGVAVFVGVPLLVASGLPQALWGAAVDVDTRFFSARPLREHLGVYLWPSLVDDARAVSLFSAAVCAQLLHYGAVLGWMPRTLNDQDRPALPWPSWPALIGGLVVVGGGLAIHFAVDFAGARAAYGLPAAIHAWLELPLLLVAFSAWSGPSSTSSTSPS